MSPMTPDEQRAWSLVRARGRRRYVAVYGVIAFGFPLMIGGEVVARLVWSGWQAVSALATTTAGLRVLAIRIVFALVVGVLVGSLHWRRSEERYAMSEAGRASAGSPRQDEHQ
jgi:hypothetical protein